jgi:hypothetical protein
MTGYGHVVEEGLERVADRRENRRAERDPAPGSGSAHGRARCLVCFRQERSASRLRFDPNGKPRSLEPLSSSSSHIARALEEPRRGPRRPVLSQPRPETASRRPWGSTMPSHGSRDDRYAEANVLERRAPDASTRESTQPSESSGRSPQIVGSRDACRRIQAPAETDEPGRDSHWARERRLRRRIACAGGSRRRRDSEGRHSLPFDPDEAEPKRRPFAVPLLRGWE